MTHGTLVVRGTDAPAIPGTYNYEEAGSFSFTADGATFGTFFRLDEWAFEPDPEPLPDCWVLMAVDYDHNEVLAVYMDEEKAMDARDEAQENPPGWTRGMTFILERTNFHK